MNDRKILMSAIQECDNKNLTDDRRLNIIGKALYDTAFQQLKKISELGAAYEESEEDDWLAEVCWKQFKKHGACAHHSQTLQQTIR